MPVRDARWLPLSENKFALVDADIFDELVDMGKWRVHKVGWSRKEYAANRRAGRSLVLLHRVVMRAEKGQEIDHKNLDTFDCRRQNLRLASDLEQSRNRPKMKRRGITSPYKGVTHTKGRWQAAIRVAGKLLWLGTFESELVAAAAYDDAARSHFGDFAYLNFPDGRGGSSSAPRACTA